MADPIQRYRYECCHDAGENVADADGEWVRYEDVREVCLCAAVRTADGRVFRGHRHDAALKAAFDAGCGSAALSLAQHQGFVTSRGRFVDRKEAAMVQRMAGIVSVLTGKFTDLLFSEDLY